VFISAGNKRPLVCFRETRYLTLLTIFPVYLFLCFRYRGIEYLSETHRKHKQAFYMRQAVLADFESSH